MRSLEFDSRRLHYWFRSHFQQLSAHDALLDLQRVIAADGAPRDPRRPQIVEEVMPNAADVPWSVVVEVHEYLLGEAS